MVSEIIHYCNVSFACCPKITEHTINYYDLTFVLSGSITYIINGKETVLNKNDAIFLPPNTLRARKSGTAPVKFVSFNFHKTAGTDFPFSKYMPDCITREIRELIKVYPHAHLTPGFHSKEKCKSVLNYILYELTDFAGLNCRNTHVVKIIKYIDEHITERLSLSMLSSYVGLTREYTAAIFKRETGRTVTDYVNERKLLLARELIAEGEMSLTEIARYLGFENYNYFSRLFKAKFEVTPIRFKNMR